MAFTETDIIRQLYRHFVNYDYRLNNAFVYDWESDFFAVSGSAYCVEVEVKISRGDYFRDFEKDKHLLFGAHQEKKKFYITKFNTRGDRIGSVKVGKLEGVDDFENKRPSRFAWGVKHNGKHGYWVNDNTNAYIRWYTQDLYAPASGIHFHKVEGRKCPNQFYYACPAGMLKENEIPPYAGLIHCGSECSVIRRAPYLHKIKQDMTRELLKQFYNRWEYKQTMESKIDLNGQFKLFSQKELSNENTQSA